MLTNSRPTYSGLQRDAGPKLSCTSLPLTPYSSASLSSAVASTCGWNRRCQTSVAAWWHVFHSEAQTPLWHSDLKHPRTIWVTAFARRMGWFVCFNCLAAAAYSGANLETFQPVWSKCNKGMLGQNTACRIKCQLSSRMISIRLNHFLSIKERWTVLDWIWPQRWIASGCWDWDARKQLLAVPTPWGKELH